MTREELKGYINKAIQFAAFFAAFTSTKVDDTIVEALLTLAENDKLIDLVAKLFADGDVVVPAGIEAEWEEIQPAIRPLQKAMRIPL